MAASKQPSTAVAATLLIPECPSISKLSICKKSANINRQDIIDITMRNNPTDMDNFFIGTLTQSFFTLNNKAYT